MTQDVDEIITTKFQKNIVATLQPTIPPLAALHASRYRSLHLNSNMNIDDTPSNLFSPLHCSRCGWLALSVRIERKSARGGDKDAANRKRKRKRRAGEVQTYTDTDDHQPISTSTTRKKRILIRSACNACGYIDIKPVKLDNRTHSSTLSRTVPLGKASVSALPITKSLLSSMEKDENLALNSDLNSTFLAHNSHTAIAFASDSTSAQNTVSPEFSEVQRRSKKKIISTSASTSVTNNHQLHHLLVKQKQRDRERGSKSVPAQGSLAAFLNELG